jgi:ABC-type polysaccharide/polyol phosphate export permease
MFFYVIFFFLKICKFYLIGHSICYLLSPGIKMIHKRTKTNRKINEKIRTNRRGMKMSKSRQKSNLNFLNFVIFISFIIELKRKSFFKEKYLLFILLILFIYFLFSHICFVLVTKHSYKNIENKITTFGPLFSFFEIEKGNVEKM